MKIVVIGGGAAGFFGAITCAERNPDCEVILIEKSDKLLSKVKVSGGGRCNVTHFCFEPKILVQNYPRGNKVLQGPFSRFQAKDTVEWFESRGVELKTEEDGRIFPESNTSQTIVDCLLTTAGNAGVKIWTRTGVKNIRKKGGEFVLELSSGPDLHCDRILIATGGHPKAEGYQWLKDLGHSIELPVPSLFTFNINDKELQSLAGLSVEKAAVKIPGTKLEQEGPLLITHWGMSGPAVLKLSAWGARALSELNYDFTILVCWMPDYKETDLLEKLLEIKTNESRKQISTFSPFPLPLRLWKYIISKAGIGAELRWADLSKKNQNKLLEELLRSSFPVKGKSTFKEEFVTCGGISLKDVNFKTMESLKSGGVFFAGEILDIDGVTGGFNFQNAWTTGWIAGMAIANK